MSILDNEGHNPIGLGNTPSVKTYSKEAIARAREGALYWLEGNTDGYPRSWQQEAANDRARGYVLYDDFEAPPIAGYEALEREGLAVRQEIVVANEQERVHFKLNSRCEQKAGNDG